MCNNLSWVVSIQIQWEFQIFWSRVFCVTVLGEPDVWRLHSPSLSLLQSLRDHLEQTEKSPPLTVSLSSQLLAGSHYWNPQVSLLEVWKIREDCSMWYCSILVPWNTFITVTIHQSVPTWNQLLYTKVSPHETSYYTPKCPHMITQRK